jgi:hypothetical protein
MAELADDTPVRVVEVVSEAQDPGDDPPELTQAIDAAAVGQVLVQLRRTTPRVTVGSGLSRRPGLLDAVRALPQAPLVTTTSAGGTFVVGGPRWLALSAVARPPAGTVTPLDWTLAALRGWVSSQLVAAGMPPVACGVVEGAWCPGFSDLSVGGRKLVGLGFRVTRERVLARGTIAVLPLDDAELELLRGCHALIGKDVRRSACTSLAELSEAAGGPGAVTVDGAVRLLSGEGR